MIYIDDGTGIDVMHEDGVLGRVEYRPIAGFRHPQRLVGPLAFGDIGGDGKRHGVEGATQPTELITSLEIAAGSEVSRCKLLGGVDQPRSPACEQEMKYQPHGQRKRRHPPGPVERLLLHLRASFGLVALQVIRQEHVAGSRRTQFVAFAAHQHASMTEQLVATRGDGQSRAPLGHGPCCLTAVELRQHIRDFLAEPGAPRRSDDDVPVVGQRSENDIMVVRQHRDLVLCSRQIALEQQVFQCALQARHFLRQPFAVVFLRLTLGLRHVIDEVHRTEYCGKAEQNERNRDFERHGNAQDHWAPTLAAFAAEFPPEGAQVAYWGALAALISAGR